MLQLIFHAIAVAENAIVYNFIQRLIKSQCDCSSDWRREAITMMTVYNFVIILLSLLSSEKLKPASYVWFMGIYSLIYFGTVLSYAHHLRDQGCLCAEGLDADWIYYTRVIDLVVFTFAVTIGVFFAKETR